MTTDFASGAAIFQLDRSTCMALLTTQCVGRLVVGGDEPTIVPVNYVVIDGNIAFRTDGASRAGRADRTSVMFEVDVFDERIRSGWSVVVHGILVAGRDGTGPPTVDTWAPGRRDQWMTVGIDAVTGRLVRNIVDREPYGTGGYL